MDNLRAVGINARGSATRAQMLDVAEELIAARGVGGVSTREIAAAAGQANHSAVRHHFRNKETLVRAVIEDRAATIETMRLALLKTLPTPLSRDAAVIALVRPLTEHMKTHGNRSHYFRFIEQATRYFGFARTAAEMQASPGLAACVATLTQSGMATAGDDTRAYLVIGMVFRGFADREQARIEGVLTIDDDDLFGDILVASAQAAFVVHDG